MFAVYRVRLRDPARLPAGVIQQIREELRDVEIGADGQALVFMAEDPELGTRVRTAVARACGDAWGEHFHSLDDGPEAAYRVARSRAISLSTALGHGVA